MNIALIFAGMTCFISVFICARKYINEKYKQTNIYMPFQRIVRDIKIIKIEKSLDIIKALLIIGMPIQILILIILVSMK